ncbi:hypothetical protein ABVT39_015979, partial [Epinephelus coioides]
MDPGDEINARPRCRPEELFKNPQLAAMAGIIQHNRKRDYTFSKHMVLLVK